MTGTAVALKRGFTVLGAEIKLLQRYSGRTTRRGGIFDTSCHVHISKIRNRLPAEETQFEAISVVLYTTNYQMVRATLALQHNHGCKAKPKPFAPQVSTTGRKSLLLVCEVHLEISGGDK